MTAIDNLAEIAARLRDLPPPLRRVRVTVDAQPGRPERRDVDDERGGVEVIVHPVDWFDLLLAKRDGTDRYLVEVAPPPSLYCYSIGHPSLFGVPIEVDIA